jgi:hypothetical protein
MIMRANSTHIAVLKLVGALAAAVALFTMGFTLNFMTVGTRSITVTKTETNTSYVTTIQTLPTTIFITVTQEATTPTAAGWREIKRFSGSSDMTTEPFTVPTATWRIKWSYGTSQYAHFSFFVYPLGETVKYVESILPTGPSGNGTTYI